MDSNILAIKSSSTNPTDLFLLTKKDKHLIRYNVMDKTSVVVHNLENSILNFNLDINLEICPDDKYFIIAQSKGEYCELYKLGGERIKTNSRGTYHGDASDYSCGFCKLEGKTVVVLATAWNRLDMFDVESCKLLTDRLTTRMDATGKKNKYYLDYFHSTLNVSPSGIKFLDSGWVWQPMGWPEIIVCHEWAKFPHGADNDWFMNVNEVDGQIQIQPDPDHDHNIVNKVKGKFSFEHEGMYNPGCWISDTELVILYHNTFDNERDFLESCGKKENYEDDGKGYGDFIDPHPDRKKYALFLHTNSPKKLCEFDAPQSFENNCTISFCGHIFVYAPNYGIVAYDVNTGDEVYSRIKDVPVAYHKVARKFIIKDGDSDSDNNYKFWSYPSTIEQDFNYLVGSKLKEIMSMLIIRNRKEKENSLINKIPLHIFNHIYKFV